MKNRRPLTESELELWRRSTADVRRLVNGQTSEPVAMPAVKPKATKTVPRPTIETVAGSAGGRPRQLATARDPKGPVDIDRRSWERLKRGKMSVERKLDLHGKTQAEAHEALDRFLAMALATGLRCVLVVTGKGGPDGRGVLRRMVPRWLGEAGIRDKILTYSPAQPRHGGDGALYILLRRQRNGRR